MGCDPPGPPFPDVWAKLRWELCELYKGSGGDCCDLFPPTGDNDPITNANLLTTRYRAHRDAGGFSDPEDAAAFLSRIDELEVTLGSLGSSFPSDARTVLEALIADARSDLAS